MPISPRFNSGLREMSENGRHPKLSHAVADALEQRELRSGTGRGVDGPRPQEFDTNGFPVPQPNTSFVQRVARLLAPEPEGEAR